MHHSLEGLFGGDIDIPVPNHEWLQLLPVVIGGRPEFRELRQLALAGGGTVATFRPSQSFSDHVLQPGDVQLTHPNRHASGLPQVLYDRLGSDRNMYRCNIFNSIDDSESSAAALLRPRG